MNKRQKATPSGSGELAISDQILAAIDTTVLLRELLAIANREEKKDDVVCCELHKHWQSIIESLPDPRKVQTALFRGAYRELVKSPGFQLVSQGETDAGYNLAPTSWHHQTLLHLRVERQNLRSIKEAYEGIVEDDKKPSWFWFWKWADSITWKKNTTGPALPSIHDFAANARHERDLIDASLRRKTTGGRPKTTSTIAESVYTPNMKTEQFQDALVKAGAKEISAAYTRTLMSRVRKKRKR